MVAFVNSTRVRALVAVITIGLAPYSAAGERLLPVDEGSSARGFVEFRDSLLEALARRDVDFVLAHLDPMVKSSLGPDGIGVDSFLRNWRLHTAASEFWSELRAVLELGGSSSAEGTYFCAPYVFTRWPDEMDSYSNLAVVSDAASMHEHPDTGSPRIAMLSFEIVGRGDAVAPAGWQSVRFGERAGFVRSSLLRSPIAPRACFRLRDGGWRMTFFSGGD